MFQTKLHFKSKYFNCLSATNDWLSKWKAPEIFAVLADDGTVKIAWNYRNNHKWKESFICSNEGPTKLLEIYHIEWKTSSLQLR